MNTKENFPKIALGAWAWGNDGTFGNNHSEQELQPIFDTAMENGLNLWDTAYVYGMGTSEKTLAGFLKGLDRNAYFISDKFTPQCADENSETPVADMLETEYGLLGTDHMDIYWIHNPVNAPHWTEELAKYYEGKDNVPVLGVSNHNLEEIKEAQRILESHGLKLGAVQNHYSLINRSSEDAGILDYCRENDIIFFSYMVLEQGALSGTYGSENPMPADSDRGRTYNPMMDKLDVLNSKIKEIARKHDASPAQISVAWAIAKGTLPIVGVTKTKHVLDAAKAAEIKFDEEDVKELQDLADSLGLNTIRYWEKKMD